ncbi:HET-domain-containing protein [Patellaria atrata CBS 101060]|uniref:HET-domain-containing protein n=1 Tax=Patellaria atrata CBS 101060 TaxID=1346257 RepID=A0A9P4SFE1_9PEZI|nr:HET-domain-containing protein [Patellaria atrata CBS 101060]
MEPLDQLCDACASLYLIREDFIKPPFERGRDENTPVLERTLGVLRRSQKCPLCRLILHTLLKNERGNLPTGDDVQWLLFWGPHNPEYEPSELNEHLFGSGLYANLVSNRHQREYRIELVHDDLESGFLRARKLSQDGVEIQRLRGWISACKNTHGDVHKKSYFRGSRHPSTLQDFRVIDVRQQCLIRLDEEKEYVALSYVWGTKNNVMTKRTNVDGISSEGAFSHVVLPKTIQDAIDLTRELGYLYLWVDSLCIVQDDDKVKLNLIANMDSIYANSTVTIVAASGTDASTGLSGYEKGSRGSTNGLLEIIRPDLQLGILPHFAVELRDSWHATRGWTFQEVALSPRCLVFLNGSVYFSCLDSLWREDVVETPDVEAAGGASTFGIHVMEQPLQQYGALVEPYSERNLTFPSDGLHAFAGVLSALNEHLSNSRLFYGIPAAVFDWGLLWETVGDLTRRPCFPSWSWVGVKSRLLLPSPCGIEVDHNWLLRRTWIDWYIFCLPEAILIPVWDPERDKTQVTKFEEADANRVEDDGSGSDELEEDERGNMSEGDAEDDYEEPCPTYGSPSAASLYGRLDILLPNTWAVNPRDGTSITTYREQLSYPDGTLHFETLSIRLQIDRQFLLDPQGRKCGVLKGSLLPPVSPNPEEHQILILSWASPGTTGGGHVYTKDLDTEYHVSDEAISEGGGADVQWEPLVGEWHAWAYMNVLVVRPTEKSQQQEDIEDILLERVGVGLLHVRVLDQMSEEKLRWRKVWLY